MAGSTSYFDPIRRPSRRDLDVHHSYTSPSCIHGDHRDCTVYCTKCVTRCECQCHQTGLY